MEVFFKLALWLHLMGLVMGLGGGMANSQIGPAIGGATNETRPTLWKLHHGVSRIAMIGLIIMLITGPLMVWLRYPDISTLSNLFWVKMGLVVLMLIAIFTTVRAASKAEKGDLAAAKTMAIAGPISGLLSAATVLVAVLTFG